MGNELEHIHHTFFPKEQNAIHYLGNVSGLTKLTNYLNKLVPFDHPDGYAILDDEVLIFEHFEFDSSNNARKKGSQQRRSKADDDRQFAHVNPSEEGTLYHGTIDAEYTIENYIENAKRVFLNHYSEIPGYIKTLRDKGIIRNTEKVSKLFFIEDTTLLGNIYESEKSINSWEPLLLPFCDFFLDLFDSSPDLDMAICASWYPNEYCLWFIDRSMIQEYRKYEIKTESVTIINLTPQSLGAKISISNDKLFGEKRAN